MKRLMILLVTLAAFTSLAGATLLYDNSIETGYRFNPNDTDLSAIALDDVLIPVADLGGYPALDVTKVTVGIRRVTGAPAVDVELYYAEIADATQATIETPVYIGVASLPAVTASHTQLLSAGDGVNPLFQVTPDTNLVTGYGAFAIGVRLSNSDGLNGWRMTNGPSPNADVFWEYKTSDNTQSLYSFGGDPAATFYVQVEGTPVPEPGTFAALGMGVVTLAGMVIRRRK